MPPFTQVRLVNRMLRRPSNLPDVCKALEEHSQEELTGYRETVRLGIVHMLGSFMKDALEPLYEANTLVSFTTNTITPSLVDLLIDEKALDKKVKEAMKDKAEFAIRANSFESIMSKLGTSCRDAEARESSCSTRFVTMRKAMLDFCTHKDILNGLKVVYCTDDSTKIILDLMLERMEIALREHDDIMQSTDIPIKAMMLGS